MKKFIALALALCLVPFLANAQKKEKKKDKPTKTYEWTWDGTKSGNEKVDNYLVTIDTLWNQIQNYGEQMDQYTFHTDTLTINDKDYVMAYMTNSEGKLVTRGTCNWQLVESLTKGIKIGSDAAKAAGMGASAAAALPSLGMKGLSFAKYLKGAPNIISMATKEIKEVVGIQKSNAKTWKDLKTDAVEDLESLNYFNEEQIKTMRRCIYLKEIKETDSNYQVVREKQVQKTQEQLDADKEKVFAMINKPVSDEDHESGDKEMDALLNC